MQDVNHKITVEEVALPPEKMVILEEVSAVRTAVEEISKKRQGIACIVDAEGRLVGVFTDGDLRRVLLNTHRPFAALFADDVSEFMTKNPKTATPTQTVADAVTIMEAVDVYDLPRDIVKSCGWGFARTDE